MPSLYIDGEWVASANGECSPVVNPSDASVITEVDVATDEQVQAPSPPPAEHSMRPTGRGGRPANERRCSIASRG